MSLCDNKQLRKYGLQIVAHGASWYRIRLRAKNVPVLKVEALMTEKSEVRHQLENQLLILLKLGII